MRLFALALLASLVGSLGSLPVPSSAQYCGRPYVPYCPPTYYPPPTYHPPTYHNDYVAPVIALPVLVPSTVFQYIPAVGITQVSSTVLSSQNIQAAGVATTNTGTIQIPVTTGVTTVTARAPVTTTATSVAAQAPAAARPTAATATSTAAIDRLIRARLEVILREQYAKGGYDDPPPVGNSGEELSAQSEQVEEASAPQADLQSQALAFANVHCAACHGDKKQEGTVQLFHTESDQLLFQPTRDGAPLNMATIIKSIRTGHMPRVQAKLGNRALTADEKRNLIAGLEKIEQK